MLTWRRSMCREFASTKRLHDRKWSREQSLLCRKARRHRPKTTIWSVCSLRRVQSGAGQAAFSARWIVAANSCGSQLPSGRRTKYTAAGKRLPKGSRTIEFFQVDRITVRQCCDHMGPKTLRMTAHCHRLSSARRINFRLSPSLSRERRGGFTNLRRAGQSPQSQILPF